jgi:hypothetical protein
MKRFNIHDHSFYGICPSQLADCEAIQDPKLIAVMKKKAEGVASNFSFASYTERLIFIDAFYKGYLSAFIVNNEQEEVEREITPLGQALKEG